QMEGEREREREKEEDWTIPFSPPHFFYLKGESSAYNQTPDFCRSKSSMCNPLGSVGLFSTGSPSGHNRATTLIPADRVKQMFGPPVITVKTPMVGKSNGGGTKPTSHHLLFSHPLTHRLPGPSAFSTMQYLPQQQPGYAIHGHFPAAQAGFIPPSTTIPLQKQLEHANQQSGFSDSSTLRPMLPQALHPNQGLLQASQLPVQMQTTTKVSPGREVGTDGAHPVCPF
uniref:Uncharacterized protein n=1 Tax=Laticauda laticaudata TaxID=8630 RepID=A0A8C5RL37_LATLA